MQSILVNRSSMPNLEEYMDEIKELWESHWITNMCVKHMFTITPTVFTFTCFLPFAHFC